MAIRIKIAPDIEEITRDGNIFSCHFNNMNIRWCIALDCSSMPQETENKLKEWLQSAIAFSGKTWQLPYILNQHLPFPSTIYVNERIVDYPKS